MDDLVTPQAFEGALALINARGSLQEHATHLSHELHDLVPKVGVNLRRQVLRLRRDVFNLRSPHREDIRAVPSSVFRERLDAFCTALGQLQSLEVAYRQAFRSELPKARDRLNVLLADRDFLAGVHLSSRPLAATLHRASANGRRPLDRKTEQGLLRYLTRMAGKATPFGRFCAIGAGTLGPSREPLAIQGDPRRKHSRIRANKALMKGLLAHLLRDTESRYQLPLRLNPTLSLEPESLRFLAAFNLREAFQAIERNAALDAVLSGLAGRSRTRETIRSLAARIAALPELEATSEEAERYLNRLFEVGLLQLDLPELGHDPEWPAPLLELIGPISGSTAADEVRGFLETLKAGVEEMRTQGIAPGPGPLSVLEEMVASTLPDWTGQPLKAWSPVVYEDAALDGRVAVSTGHFAPALAALKEVLTLLAPLGFERIEQAGMRRFFDERFGKSRVPLLAFYESYYREHVKPKEEALRKKDGGKGELQPPASPPAEAVGDIQAAAQRLFRIVAREWARDPEAREIHLKQDDVQAVAGPVSPLGDDPRSVSAFVSWTPRPGVDGGGRIVLPYLHCLPGFGKYFSRFLYLLPDEVLEALRAEAALPRGVALAEIAGDQAFNANLRPPIQPCEIVYPTGDRIGCPEPIEVAELEVGAGEDRQRLDLLQRGTDRRILPLDLGFLNPRMRPPLYQLLRRFSPSASIRLNLPTQIAAAAQDGGERRADGTPDVVRRPRIVYEDLVVLARETWALPGDTIPSQGPGEDEADYFLRAQEWRLACGLPDRVYLRTVAVTPPRGPAGPGKGGRDGQGTDASPAASGGNAPAWKGDGPQGPGLEEDGGTRDDDDGGPEGEGYGIEGERPGARARADLRKPQYLDFRSPLLVGLLHRYRSPKDAFIAVFEECLPSLEDLPLSTRGEPFVTETILQLEIGPSPHSEESPALPALEAAHV